jgi:hypothetical protein
MLESFVIVVGIRGMPAALYAVLLVTYHCDDCQQYSVGIACRAGCELSDMLSSTTGLCDLL